MPPTLRTTGNWPDLRCIPVSLASGGLADDGLTSCPRRPAETMNKTKSVAKGLSRNFNEGRGVSKVAMKFFLRIIAENGIL